EGARRMDLLLRDLAQPMLREGRMLATHRDRLVALHRIVNQMRATVGPPEIDSVVNLLPGRVVHRGAESIEGEDHHSGEVLFLHQAVEITAHGGSSSGFKGLGALGEMLTHRGRAGETARRTSIALD